MKTLKTLFSKSYILYPSWAILTLAVCIFIDWLDGGIAFTLR